MSRKPHTTAVSEANIPAYAVAADARVFAAQQSDGEVLGQLLNDQPLADRLLKTFGSLRGLRRAWGAWATELDVSPQVVATLSAAFELGRRAEVQTTVSQSLDNPQIVAKWARTTLSDLGHEEIWVAALDAKQVPCGVRRVAQGGVTGCSTTARDVLRAVLQLGGVAFILIHNHPSGDPTPSVDDVTMTKAVAKAANEVGTPLLDHVVVGTRGHVSLLEIGVLG